MKRAALLICLVAGFIIQTGCGCGAHTAGKDNSGSEDSSASDSAKPPTPKTKNEDAGLTYLSFKYSGTIIGFARSLTLDLSDGKPTLTLGDIRMGAESMELEPSVMEEAEAICEEFNVRSWDGFDRSVSNLYDGEGFALIAEYSDGTSVSAKGYASFPEGYSDFKRKLMDMLEPHIDELVAKSRH